MVHRDDGLQQLKLFGGIKEGDPRYAQTYAEIFVLFQRKEFEKALKLHDTVFDKRRASDWSTRANILANLGRLDEALKCYNEAINKQSGYIKAWYRKAWIHWGKREFKTAYWCFMTSANLGGEDSDPPNALHFARPDILTRDTLSQSHNGNPWRSAAILMATVTLIAERNYKTANQLVSCLNYCYQMLIAYKLISEETMPKDSLRAGKFSDFLFENNKVLLDKIEPAPSIDIVDGSGNVVSRIGKKSSV